MIEPPPDQATATNEAHRRRTRVGILPDVLLGRRHRDRVRGSSFGHMRSEIEDSGRPCAVVGDGAADEPNLPLEHVK